jgi:hypothetical protein
MSLLESFETEHKGILFGSGWNQELWSKELCVSRERLPLESELRINAGWIFLIDNPVDQHLKLLKIPTLKNCVVIG